MGVKETIKDVSLDLLVEYGIHGMSTKMITEKADISNGSLFYYFKTKDDIVIALYKDFKQELMETLYVELQNVSGVRNFYYEYFKTSVLWAIENPKKKMFINMYSHMPAVRACHDYLDVVQLEFVNSFLEQTIIDKDIIAYDFDSLVITLLGAIDSIVLYLNTNESANQMDYIDFFFTQFWRSLVNF
jgi:AcrR family transcriptional regulator